MQSVWGSNGVRQVTSSVGNKMQQPGLCFSHQHNAPFFWQEHLHVRDGSAATQQTQVGAQSAAGPSVASKH
jgi:hypothetical protein